MLDIGIDICCSLGLLCTFLDVGLDVEVGKQYKEEGSMKEDDVAEDLGEVTLEEERKAGVDEECDELYHLQRSQVSKIKKRLAYRRA